MHCTSCLPLGGVRPKGCAIPASPFGPGRTYLHARSAGTRSTGPSPYPPHPRNSSLLLVVVPCQATNRTRAARRSTAVSRLKRGKGRRSHFRAVARVAGTYPSRKSWRPSGTASGWCLSMRVRRRSTANPTSPTPSTFVFATSTRLRARKLARPTWWWPIVRKTGVREQFLLICCHCFSPRRCGGAETVSFERGDRGQISPPQSPDQSPAS